MQMPKKKEVVILMHWQELCITVLQQIDDILYLCLLLTNYQSSNWFSFFANCSHLFILQTLAKSQAIYNSLLLSKEASELSNVTIVE